MRRGEWVTTRLGSYGIIVSTTGVLVLDINTSQGRIGGNIRTTSTQRQVGEQSVQSVNCTVLTSTSRTVGDSDVAVDKVTVNSLLTGQGNNINSAVTVGDSVDRVYRELLTVVSKDSSTGCFAAEVNSSRGLVVDRTTSGRNGSQEILGLVEPRT